MTRFFDAIKQLQALIGGAIPFFTTTKINLLPFLNPAIAEELWVITALFALVGCALNFNLAQNARTRKVSQRAMLWALLVAAAAFLGLLALTVLGTMESMPRPEDLSVRVLFIVLFVACSVAIGYGTSLLAIFLVRFSK